MELTEPKLSLIKKDLAEKVSFDSLKLLLRGMQVELTKAGGPQIDI